MNDKSWREQTIPNIGQGNIVRIYFSDTNPNYILFSNPSDSPIYMSTSPQVSSMEADMVIPPTGRVVFSQAFGVKEIYVLCLDSDEHKLRVKSWEGEFDPSIINQTQQTIPSSGSQKLGTVTVDNFPSTQDVDITTQLPTGTNKIGSVAIDGAIPAGTNNVGKVDVNSLPAIPAGTNNVGKVDVNSLPAIPTGNNNIGKVHITNGSIEAMVEDGNADGRSASDTALQTLARLQAFNGSSWDRLRVDTNKNLLVRIQGVPTVGSQGNAWNNVAVVADGFSSVVDLQQCSSISVMGNVDAETIITVYASQDGSKFYNTQIDKPLLANQEFYISVPSFGARYIRLKSDSASTITATIAGKA
jgi:hypothetical protein